MKNKFRNILALILSAVMLISIIPTINVFAADGEYTLLVNYNDGTTEDVVVNEENIREKLQAIVDKEGYNEWFMGHQSYVLPDNGLMLYAHLSDENFTPDINGKYALYSKLGRVEIILDNNESFQTTINLSDVGNSIKAAIEKKYNGTATVTSYSLPDNKEVTKENWLAYMNANPTVNWAPVNVDAEYTTNDNPPDLPPVLPPVLSPGSLSVKFIKADGTEKVLTSDDYDKPFGEFLDFNNYIINAELKMEFNGNIVNQQSLTVDSSISTLTAEQILSSEFGYYIAIGAKVECTYKEISDNETEETEKDETEKDETEKEETVTVVSPSSQNPSIVAGEKATVVSFVTEDGEKISLNSNRITKELKRVEGGSEIYINAGNFRLVFPKNAVKLAVDKGLTITIEINGVKFVLDGSAIEKIKSVNFAAIIKSEEYKELAKETDTIYISVTEKGEIKLSK
ncbi:MAG: hypothetical protein J6K17_02200 [Oscillospiraceae bacterium]|nr:hypothetical protein [Oscillospiraceae bacterium]